VAALLARFPLGRLELADLDGDRRATAAALGIRFVHPDDAAGDCDLVLHCSASGAGLSRGLELLGEEGELVELSWYGDREVPVALGAAFHSRRLSIRSSQVGAVSAARRARRSHADRLALAMDLLRDPVFDALVSGPVRFGELPDVFRRLADGELRGLCHVVEYGSGDPIGSPGVEES
jgi:threonine dehydrogenase-like Zn-dependent dehydrogenase